MRMLAAVAMWMVGVGGAAAQANVTATVGRPAPPPVPTGTVTGHVYCGDTQRPARFAEVQLMKQGDASEFRGPGTAVNASTSYQIGGRGRTALDGSFTIAGVAAGDYFVVAQMTGYVSPLTVAQATQQPLRGQPVAHVAENRSADVVVSMERGASVTGRVTYDDGTPVMGVPVRLRRSDTGATGGREFFGGFAGSGDNGAGQTDDRGMFRLTGVAPGKYALIASVQTETTGRAGVLGGRGGSFGLTQILSVYAPGTMHKGDARVVEIRGAEQVDGVDMQVALAGLHSVKGSVGAKSDAHALNAGSVAIVDAADASFARRAPVAEDGTFVLEYLPPGNYTMTVNGMERVAGETGGRRGGGDGGKRYTAATRSVVVGEHDVAVDAVLLDESKSN